MALEMFGVVVEFNTSPDTIYVILEAVFSHDTIYVTLEAVFTALDCYSSMLLIV